MSDSTDNQEIENHCNSESETSLKKATEKQKVDILLKPTGNAPIMKTKKWTVDSDKPIGWIIEFVKKYLKLDSSEKLTRL
ncbi:autophagy protein 12-like isoform X2 [Euwallacea fornicatus]|uniref:autophagy protein 12-like isoform X2 n=1 Tax=Euwallacea fornicatus TaxID=995702 RepID=UPI00338E284F